MEEFDFLGIGLRWLHIMAAMALFGGTLFQGIALGPASSELPEDERAKFSEAVRRRWSKVVMLSILVLLVSGVVNYLLTIIPFKVFVPPDVRPQDRDLLALPGFYHMLFGIKFLLAFGIFFIASVLSGRSKATQGMRDNPAKWIRATIVMATVLIAISATMRSTHTGPNVSKVLEAIVDKDPAPAFDPKADTSSGTTDEAPPVIIEDAPPGLSPEPIVIPE